MIKIDNRILTEWEQVQNIWKKYDAPKKIQTRFFKDIKDEEFEYIFEPFTNDDVFSPAMCGVNVDEKYIVSTNGHILICYPNKDKIQNGIYNFKTNNTLKKYEKIRAGNFPAYLNVIVDETDIQYSITTKLLRTYLAIIVNGEYEPSHGGVVFKVKGLMNDKIVLNCNYLIKILDTFSSFGEEEIWFGFNGETKAVYISNSRFNVTYPIQGMQYDLLAIIYPMFTMDSNLGTTDIDFDTECNIYFDFKTDAIVDKYGGIISQSWSSYYEPVFPPVNYNITENNFKQLFNVTKTNKNLPEFQDVLIHNNSLYARSISYDCFFIIGDVDIDDGFFQIVNGALKNINSPLNKFSDFIKVLENKYTNSYTYDIQKLHSNQFLKSYSDAVICKMSNNDTPADGVDIQIFGEKDWEFFFLQYGSNLAYNFIFFNKSITINIGLENEIKYSIPESLFCHSIIQYFDKNIYLYLKCNNAYFEIMGNNCQFIVFKKDNNFNDFSFINEYPNSLKLGFDDKIEDFTKAELKLLKETVSNNIKWNKKNKYSDISEQIGLTKLFDLSFEKISVEKNKIVSKSLILKKQVYNAPYMSFFFNNYLLLQKNDNYGAYSEYVYNPKSFKAFLEISNMKDVAFNGNYMTVKLLDEDKITTKPPKPPKTPKTPKQKPQKSVAKTTTSTPKVLTKADYEIRIKGLETLIKYATDQSVIDAYNIKLNGLKTLLKYS